ncbi:MAG TPA: D-tyrosyl-tRNA(Tyr) deacylase [Elusimicrobia bacterium]|nr:D-tyrosyl-tRNA(Tyr) deacylase [Elusimicrobiota bacterium]
MRLLIQRVLSASVRLPGGERRSIGPGLAVLVGIGSSDDEAASERLAEKAANLRIFSNEEGKFDRSLLDVRGEALVVSQFTLFGDCARGRRPDFTSAAPPAKAEPLYRAFAQALARRGVPVQTGEFGAAMQVELVNDGPVTIWIDSERL